MNRLKNILKRNSVLVIFVIFFFIVLLEHQFMGLYHDDYGYASLSYAYNLDGVSGHDVSILQTLNFLKGHYNVWGGRVLYFFFEICLLKNGIWIFRLVQSLVITLIFYFIYKIVKRLSKGNISDWLIAICTVMCYGFFEIMLVRTGIFWATASILYVFPILPFLIYIYIYQESKNSEFKNKFIKTLFYIFCAMLMFMSTFSQEQISVAALGYILILTIYNIVRNKKLNKLDIVMCIVAIIGFCILMLAPGNAIRQQHPTSIEFYSKPILERIIAGIENLVLGNFSMYTKIFNILFYICVWYASYKVVKDNKGITFVSKLSLLSTSVIIFITSIQSVGYFEWVYDLATFKIYKLAVMLMFVLQLVLMFYSVIIYLYEKKQYKVINILISAVFSIACMIIAPYFALRSSIAFEALCFIFMLYILQEVYDDLKYKKTLVYILIPIFLISMFNIFTITKGYYSNSKINEQNNETLIVVSNKIKKGEDIKVITLKKLKNILYSGDQPYTEGNDYITIYMKEYYDLPKDIEIIYE